MGDLLWMAGKAFFIALVLTPIIRDVSRSFNVVDRPGRRKVHAHPIPRVGGIAIAIAYGISLIPFSDLDNGLKFSSALSPWQVIPGAAIVFAVGLFDDLFNIRPMLKLGGLVLAATVAYWCGLHVGYVANYPLPVWIDFPVTVFWLVLASNALNLIDGLDGLCAGMGMLSSLTLFAAAVVHGNHALAYATFPLAGALAGFLIYNFNPATVFIGDSGALLVGYLLGAFGLFWTQKSATVLSMVVPLLALAIPLLDVSLSVLRRLIRGQPIFRADRGHIHHRLLDQGLSPRQAVWVLYMVGALAAAFTLLASSKFGGLYQGPIIIAFCFAAWLGIRKLRYSEFDIAGRLRFGGADRGGGRGPKTLGRIAELLQGAAEEEIWWQALVREGKGLGFTKLRWTAEGGGREAILAPSAPGGWTLRVPLGGADELQIDGAFGPGAAHYDLAALSDLLGRTCPRRGRADSAAPAGAA